jgi:hypothetical protein
MNCSSFFRNDSARFCLIISLTCLRRISYQEWLFRMTSGQGGLRAKRVVLCGRTGLFLRESIAACPPLEDHKERVPRSRWRRDHQGILDFPKGAFSAKLWRLELHPRCLSRFGIFWAWGSNSLILLPTAVLTARGAIIPGGYRRTERRRHLPQ